MFPFGSTSIPCSIWSTAMKVLVHCGQISWFVKCCFDQSARSAEYFTYLKYDILLVGISHTNNSLKCFRTKSHYNKAHRQLSYPFSRLTVKRIYLEKTWRSIFVRWMIPEEKEHGTLMVMHPVNIWSGRLKSLFFEEVKAASNIMKYHQLGECAVMNVLQDQMRVRPFHSCNFM